MLLGIRFDDGPDTLVNSGTINIGSTCNSGIMMSGDGDEFTNTGTVIGSVHMGDGDDTVVGRGTANSNGIIPVDVPHGEAPQLTTLAFGITQVTGDASNGEEAGLFNTSVQEDEGEVVTTDDDRQELAVNDAVFIPGDEPHVVANPLEEPSVGIDIFVPGRSFDFWLKRKSRG